MYYVCYVLLYCIIFAFGAAIGSFLNVCIYRLPKEESLWRNNSHCMTCGTPIRKRDLIPIFSWCRLRGKCRSCGAKIPFRYTLVESLNAILYVLIFAYFGIFEQPVYAALVCLFCSALIVVFFMDLDTQLISLYVIGFIGLLALIYAVQFTFGIPMWHDVMNKSSIANIHTLSSICAMLLFLPCSGVLSKLAMLTVPDNAEEAQELSMPVLDERLFKSPAVALQQAKNAVVKMSRRAARNVNLAAPMLLKLDEDTVSAIKVRENLIDRMEVAISNYLIKMTDQELGDDESHEVTELLNFVTEFERIGDYAVNIMEKAEELNEKEASFSESAQKELKLLEQALDRILNLTNDAFENDDMHKATQVEPLEEIIDVMVERLRDQHIRRLKDGVCSIDTGVVFLDVLNNAERISDHCSNIAARLIGMDAGEDYDSHTLKSIMHHNPTKDYMLEYEECRKAYLIPLESMEA